MTQKVFIYTRNSTISIDELRKLTPPTIELITGDDIPATADFEIMVHGSPTREHIEASPNLSAVIVPYAGASKETITLLSDYPHISLHTLHFNVAATTELGIGLMIAASKFIVPIDQKLRANDWNVRTAATPITLLKNKTVTILGYGRIGKRIGTVCQALDMKIIGVRRHVGEGHATVPADDNGVPVYPPSAIRTLLPQTDILVNVLPLTDETEGIIDKEEIALLPKHAIIVNIGRGPVIDEEALFEALKNQTILAAGIDVWYQYPKNVQERANTQPSRFPFHTLNNVVMSPHCGGSNQAAEADRIISLATLLTAAAEGRTIPDAVNKELGY